MTQGGGFSFHFNSLSGFQKAQGRQEERQRKREEALGSRKSDERKRDALCTLALSE